MTGAGASGKSDDASFKFDKDSSLIVDMILDDKENDEALANVQDFISLTLTSDVAKWHPKSFNIIYNAPPKGNGPGTINCGLAPP